MTSASTIIAAFGPFVSGWMLFWGLAAGIPILIHLWNRHRYNEVTWAAMEYLMAAMRKNSRRITIEQLILLAVRVLILLLLAIALANPMLPNLATLGTGVGAGGKTHWVIVIDGSYSMDYKAGEKTRFEMSKQLAVQLVDESTQGDGFTLIMMADRPQVVVRQPAFAREDVIEEIENLQLPHGGANLSATLSEIDKTLQAAHEKHPRLSHSKVCIFTDLGRTTWDDVEAAGTRSRVGKLAERATLVLFDVGEPAQRNLAITRFDMLESIVTVGRQVTFQAEIQNLGAQQAAQHRVEVLVDGQRVHEERVDVPASGHATVSVARQFSAPGEHHVEVRLDEDPLSVDNHRWLSVPVRESIRVLCIRGKPEAAKYVALALEPNQSNQARVRPTIAQENAIAELDLNEFDCVVLCNVERFGRDEAGMLREYLKGGGGLIFFLGDQVNLQNYNEQLGDGAQGGRVLPARLETEVAESQYRFDPLEYRHPIVAPFRGHQQSGLLTTPVWKYVKLKLYDPTTAKVALAFEQGDAAIVEEQILRGRTILFASAASNASVDRSNNPPTPWTAIYSWPSFPPLVQEMLSLAIRGKTAGRNVQVGDDLEDVVHNTVAEIPLTIASPNGRSERVKMTVDGEDSRWVYDNVQHSGIYEARLGAPRESTQYFAANVNTRESDLARYDSQLLPSQFSQEEKTNVAGLPNLSGAGGSQLFQYVLVFVLVLLFAETTLAWSFGRQRV